MEKNAEINFATIFETHDQKKVQTLHLLFFFKDRNEIVLSRAKTSKYRLGQFSRPFNTFDSSPNAGKIMISENIQY